MFTYICGQVKDKDFFSYYFIEVTKENMKEFPEGIPLFKTKEEAYSYASFANFCAFMPNKFKYSKVLNYDNFE
jgi:hypothetical protein